jgi:hypothetical protein
VRLSCEIKVKAFLAKADGGSSVHPSFVCWTAVAHSGGTMTAIAGLVHQERTRWDPKDGELCLARAKPGETLVEARLDSDVQIDPHS